MTAANSTVMRDGKQQTIPSHNLVPGDVLLLAEGDAVGADATLIEATDLYIQEAALTGESEAVHKTPEPVADDAPRWGAAPFHYAASLYSWVAEELEIAPAPRDLAPAF